MAYLFSLTSTFVQNLSDLEFDLSRSLRVKSNSSDVYTSSLLMYK